MIKVKGLNFTVILREEAEGGYSAQVVELSGCISQGENRNDALINIREAIERVHGSFSRRNRQTKTPEKDISIKV